MRNKISLSLALALTLLSSCVSRSIETYNTTIHTERGCDRILSELDYARRYKQSLHKNDKFMFRYMLIIPAIVETFQIIKNESKADKRIENLQYQAQMSNCYENNANAQSSFIPYSQNAPSSNGSQGSGQYKGSDSQSSSSSSIFSSIANLFK
jgi:hypothetical protein